MNELQAVYTVWLREMIKYFRAKDRIFSSLAMPIFWLFIFGSGIRTPVFGGEIDYTSFIAPGVVLMTIMFTSMHSGISVIWDKELGFMKEMLVAPVSRISIVVGKALGGATTALIQGIILFLLIFGIQNVSDEYFSGVRTDISTFLKVIPLMLLSALGIVGIGIAIASVLSSVESFGIIMNFVVMPMFFLSGALFPINNLPGWVRIATYLDPVTYAVEIMRFVMTGFSSINPLLSLVVLSGFTFCTLLIATYLFNKKS